MKNLLLSFFILNAVICSSNALNKKDVNFIRSKTIVETIYQLYGIDKTPLLRENYPFDDKYTASYLASEDQSKRPNPYAYLWPYSGTLSAVSALLKIDEGTYKKVLEKKVLPGLEQYFDNKRSPDGYASYIKSAPASDRFYDDNVWVGLDFTDIYLTTGKKKYLDKAKMVWTFVASGMDDKLGGGIYWCEQKKGSKNTCSNAPGAVFALKLFEATSDSVYFKHGQHLYEWTKANLQDSTDLLYFDNINLRGRIGKAKFAYNSGQMLQACALLYKLTKKEQYLIEAQRLASACFDYFFQDFQTDNGESFRMLKKGNVWFSVIMFRGFEELYLVDHNTKYMDAFQHNLDYAWENMRDENGLFNTDWSGKEKDKAKWLLTQAAMAEIYARMSILKYK